jgi:hypothetical protein
MKPIQINTDTTFKYLQVFNGILELTQKELEVLAALIDTGELNDLCDIDTKKIVAKKLNLQDFNTLNNYIKRLKDKNALIKKGSKYILAPFLTPKSQMLIQINHA